MPNKQKELIKMFDGTDYIIQKKKNPDAFLHHLRNLDRRASFMTQEEIDRAYRNFVRK
jgi:hypothetical protein